MDSRIALTLAVVTACGGNSVEPSTPAPPQATAPASEPPVSPAPTGMRSDDPGPASSPPTVATLSMKPIALPGATSPASLDYIAYERGRSRVWVPVGTTGSVDVLDVATGTFTRIDGFKTEEREARGKKRTFGPSAATVGDGFVYVNNRATSEICPIDVATLKARKCLKLPSATDGVAYVSSAKEVWVTTPKDSSLTVLDASTPGTLKTKTTVKTDGAPEGYAVDEAHGLFFTNLEDKGGTAVIDVKAHKSKATWNANCGPDGPRGMTFDAARNFLVVACTDHLQVLDAGHDGALLGRLETGGGVDNIDLVDGKVYAAAGKAAKLVVAKLDDKGQLTIVATGSTAEGARNAVADANGNAYVADAQGARLLVLGLTPAR